MVRLAILMLIFSAIIAFFAKYFAIVLQFLSHVERYVSTQLHNVLPKFGASLYISHVITLTVVPLILGAVPVLFYWLFSKEAMPKYKTVFWVIWILIVFIFLMHKIA